MPITALELLNVTSIINNAFSSFYSLNRQVLYIYLVLHKRESRYQFRLRNKVHRISMFRKLMPHQHVNSTDCRDEDNKVYNSGILIFEF